MEEDGSVKAPVTRLRRRLSVELSEESKSPAGPSTPTKKRGGRLAAKPQLELIDENTPQNSPKKTTRRRSTAKDLVEMEEKPLTPSRRSTRIKSNTSILSDTPQAAVDSPRAKRALRRNSQIGSDTETPIPVTPARTRRGRKDSTTSLDKQTTATSASGTPVTPARIRRTRKDSASSVDKPADNEEASKTALINEIIAEEPENNIRKSFTNDGSPSEKNIDSSPSSPRKSPRLLAKKTMKSKSNNNQNESIIEDSDVNMNISSGKSKLANTKSETCDINIALVSKQEDVVDGTCHSRLSLSSANILNSLDEEPNKKPNLNKSTSSLLQIPSVIKTKRYRTKSWTTLSSPSSKEGNFYSDNESTKKKFKNISKTFMKLSKQSESGDGAVIENYIEKSNISLERQEENDVEKYSNSSMKKKKHSQNQTSKSDKSMKESTLKQLKNTNKSAVQSPKLSKGNVEGNKENLDDQESKNPTELLFQNAPSSIVQSMLFIEDSDSNSESLGKAIKNAEKESEDQLVPEVDQVKSDDSLKKSESNILNLPNERQVFTSLPTTSKNDTCEPMDIDETMPENVSLADYENKSVNESKNKSSQKSSLYNSHDISANKSINKSKRKFSLSNSVSQDHEKTDSGNKSTLILSQIKDLSTGDQDTSKTTNDSKQVNEQLSKSLQETDTTKKVVNKNISMSCLTSTPVQQKDNNKLPIQMNTSAITPHNESKKIITEKKKSISEVSRSSQSGSSDEVSDDDSEHNILVFDEAKDAGDDYESGDSQDEEERQYVREHEIVDKGETLTSEDEASNDSDYEKDSFIVSSDEEDNELLSGSGEDLDMSDNELTMSAKSKKKYNERLSKQQKKASREMFQARHELDKSDQSSVSKIAKKNKTRLDSKLLESSDDAVVPPKKKKRMRLESTMDSSAVKSNSEESKPERTKTVEVEKKVVKKKKSKSLSESMSKSGEGNEMEVSNENDVQDKSVSEAIRYKKNKSKRLSEPIYNESVVNEKEITAIYDTTTADDPLHLQIKQEPKTPQKELDISTVHFTIREEIEQVQINENVSIMKGNETTDPLLHSMTQDENSDDDISSISENEEITKNYDSILNKLNKDTKQKIKSVDISLNLSKKEKEKAKSLVLDQLNITQTKKTKSKKVETTDSKSIFKKTVISDVDADDATSDSTDLNLLFSDDSNDSAKASSVLLNKTDTVEKIIQLKRTEGKTNLLSSLNASQIKANDTSLNTSIKKKNKSKSKEKENTAVDTDGQTLPFFIDTVGFRDETPNNSAITITKKNKNNSLTINSDGDVGITGNSKVDSNDFAEFGVLNTSLKNKNKSKEVLLSVEDDATNRSETNDKPTKYLSIDKTPGNKKKKKVDQVEKSDKELSITEKHNKSVEDQKAAMETSSGVSNKRENKKRKRLSSAKDEVEDVMLQGSGDVPITNVINQINESLVSNSKKKRKLIQKSKDIAEKSRKRKEREDDIHEKKSKVLKQNSCEKKEVPRLPTTILELLEDKPKRQFNETNVPKVVSTTEFKVEVTRKRRNKPSNFLEESIYLNTDSESSNLTKQTLKVKKPTVLPFTPTVSISDSGFTTKFHITPIPHKIEFVAQSNETTNFKTDYLNARRSKKLRTYELYKNHRNVKLLKY